MESPNLVFLIEQPRFGHRQGAEKKEEYTVCLLQGSCDDDGKTTKEKQNKTKTPHSLQYRYLIQPDLKKASLVFRL